MNCQKCSQNMSAYLDGELDTQASGRTEAHLSSCDACSAELQSLRESARFIEANTAEPRLSPETWVKIHERISAPEIRVAKPQWSEFFFGQRRWLMGATAAAALLISVGIGSLLIQRRQVERDAFALMERYSRMRDIEEQWHFAQEVDPAIVPPEDIAGITPPAINPFAVVKYDPDKNPFRSEEP